MAFTADAALAVLFYVLLRDVHRTVALVAAALRLVAHPAIGAVNLLNHLGALWILESGALGRAFGPGQREALAAFALEMHGFGYLVAGAFFGGHCALLGWLLYRSPLFPRLLGLLLAAAGGAYLFETFAVFLAPGLAGLATMLVVAAAGIGEVALCLYLLVRGVRPTE